MTKRFTQLKDEKMLSIMADPSLAQGHYKHVMYPDVDQIKRMIESNTDDNGVLDVDALAHDIEQAVLFPLHVFYNPDVIGVALDDSVDIGGGLHTVNVALTNILPDEDKSE